jgi:glycosyltransferase involved in cell wall biosynthesis
VLEIQDVIAGRLLKFPPSRTAERLREFCELLPRLKGKYSAGSFDLIWIEHSFLFPFLPELLAYFRGIPVVCNAHNVEFSYHERMAELVRTSSARRWWRRQARAMKKAEAAGFEAASLTFCCSRQDELLIRDVAPLARVDVMPNGVDTAYFENHFAETARPSVVFTGGMSYAPNQDAVRYFVADILPLIRKEVPDCLFILAGSSATGRFPEIELNDRLTEIASDVADIRPYIGKAWVYVAPLRVGSGTRLKILEAMSMGKAIVSSPIGAEGIDTATGDNLILAEDAESFADAVVSLLRGRETAGQMGASARRLVCKNCDWRLLTSRAIATCESYELPV